MKKLEIVSYAKNAFNSLVFQAKKHSPEILAVVGTIGVGVGVVTACKATTKLSGILEESKDDIDRIHDAMANEEYAESGKYTEEDGKKDLTITYVQTGLKVVKLYAPSAIITGLSVGCLLTSNQILRKRNVALAAAYSAVDTSFKKYRSRVVDQFGEEIDRKLRFGIKAKEIEETVVDENGEEHKVSRIVDMVDIDGSDYAVIFDECNPYHEPIQKVNEAFIKAQQTYANQKLISQGRLFLNEVYSMLGFEPTKAGQIMGWIYDPANPNVNNYVDFGVFHSHRQTSKDFLNGLTDCVVLDFNVDGNVWESM